MKKTVISLMLAASTCFAMIAPASAALNDSSKQTVHKQNHKDDTHEQKNKTSNPKTVKQQEKITKETKNTKQANNKKQTVNTKAVTPKKSTAQQQPSKSKNVTSDHKSKDSEYDKNHKS